MKQMNNTTLITKYKISASEYNLFLSNYATAQIVNNHHVTRLYSNNNNNSNKYLDVYFLLLYIIFTIIYFLRFF